jgi:hypothetical protein
MRCCTPRCQRPGRVVVDRHPARSAGGPYYPFCWPCYFEFCRAGDHPAVVNYIDKDDKDESLRWDVARQRYVVGI